MGAIRQQVIDGFNSLVAEQKFVKGKCTFSLVFFNTEDDQKVVFDRIPIDEVPDLTSDTFQPAAGTPLFDAACKAIKATGEQLAGMERDDRPEMVVFVIMTDGFENSSREYGRASLVGMIEHQSNKYSWQFVFPAANVDAREEAAALGIQANKAVDFKPTPAGVEKLYRGTSAKLKASREALTSGGIRAADAALNYTDEEREDLMSDD